MFFLLTLCLAPACSHHQNQKTRIKSKDITQTPAVASPWSSKKISELSLDESWAAYDYYKKHNRLPHLAAVLERLVLLTPDQSQLEPLLTELSDLKISLGLYEEAETLLDEYCAMYPGNPVTPKKKLQLIAVQIQQNPSAERDLSKTEKALASAYTLYQEQVATPTQQLTLAEQEELKKHIRTAQQLLATKALNKIEFYTTRYRYTQKTPPLKAAMKTALELMQTLKSQPTPQLLSAEQLALLEPHAQKISILKDSQSMDTNKLLNSIDATITTLKSLIQG